MPIAARWLTVRFAGAAPGAAASVTARRDAGADGSPRSRVPTGHDRHLDLPDGDVLRWLVIDRPGSVPWGAYYRSMPTEVCAGATVGRADALTRNGPRPKPGAVWRVSPPRRVLERVRPLRTSGNSSAGGEQSLDGRDVDGSVL